MHETHLIKPVIEGISRHVKEEGGKTVTNIKLKIGELIGTNKDSFIRTFRILAKDTMLENADLELIFSPGTRVEVISFDIE